jgi:hypothetical protein
LALDDYQSLLFWLFLYAKIDKNTWKNMEDDHILSFFFRFIFVSFVSLRWQSDMKESILLQTAPTDNKKNYLCSYGLREPMAQYYSEIWSGCSMSDNGSQQREHQCKLPIRY